MKNVLIISTSLRGGSNSELLAKECAKGAEEAGNRVELLSLKGKKIQYCIGCLSCMKTGKCVQKDDAPEIMEKLRRADVLVFATPIYYYEMCGQMKTFPVRRPFPSHRDDSPRPSGRRFLHRLPARRAWLWGSRRNLPKPFQIDRFPLLRTYSRAK